MENMDHYICDIFKNKKWVFKPPNTGMNELSMELPLNCFAQMDNHKYKQNRQKHKPSRRNVAIYLSI